MGKCDKVLLKKLLCEFLASLIIQFIGCSLPDVQSAQYVADPVKRQKDQFNIFLDDSLKQESPTDQILSSLGLFSASGMGGVVPPGREKTDIGVGFSRSPVLYAFAWGGAVMVFTQAFRIVSGAHLNPAISIASMIVQNVTVFDGIMYILMHLTGSFIGHVFVWALYVVPIGTTGVKYCATRIKMPEFWQGIVLEFFMTSTYVFAMCASWHKSNEQLQESISLRIGAVVIALIMVGAPHTMSCMHPFRSLWPAIAGFFFEHIYVYVFVPIVAAIAMACFWRFLVLQNKNETVKSGGGGGGGGE